MNWEVVEEWAKRDKFGVDGGLTAVAYRDELIKCARLAVAERERADELARERNKALEVAAIAKELLRDESDSQDNLADRFNQLIDREARALSRLAEIERALERLDRQIWR